ncbi:MAG TPA: AtpZ/AtpI family protein [Nocardioidaceae bacterium]|nr:AtpZ/AtpI family protein [Nocardioidaceae bacterium]
MGSDGTRDTGDGQQALRGRDLVGLGGLLVGCVVAGLVVGYVLDGVAGTTPALTLVGIFLGIAAGAVGFWLRVRRFLRP